MSTYTNEMFQSIKGALQKNETMGARLRDQLRLEAPNSYTVRLLPHTKDPSKTFLHYYAFSWKSLSTGQTLVLTSPTSWGERDPIAEERYRVYRIGTETEKEKIKAIRRSENWLINAYIVTDPVNPDNNGKIKVIRFGRQLHKIINDAMDGEGAEDVGPRMFDLSPNGCSLVIKVEKQGDYPTYVASKFRSPKAVEGLTDADYERIYGSVFDLSQFLTTKSYDELQLLLNQHYHCIGATPAVAKPAPVSDVKQQEVSTPAITESTNSASTVVDPELEKLMQHIK
jgi:hypothetical protein